MPENKSIFSSKWVFDGVKLIVTVIVATISATVTATWTVRGLLDEHDKRITVLERTTDQLNKGMVPREEHVAHWTAQEQSLSAIREDIRDMRREKK